MEPNQDKNNDDHYDFKKSSHPCLILWGFIFKGLPIFFYFFSVFICDTLIIEISCVLLLSTIDFWFTKNIRNIIILYIYLTPKQKHFLKNLKILLIPSGSRTSWSKMVSKSQRTKRRAILFRMQT